LLQTAKQGDDFSVLGSLTIITDAAGNVKQKCTFDVWGKRTFVTKDNTLIFDRGFTGHEHLDEFGLINMNGRMYDPIVGRFLSPDLFVQAPEFSQSFNRYSYALNNPLKYTDPDGEVWWLVPAITAIVFGIGNTATHAMRGDIDNVWDGLKYFGQGAVVGFALGAAWQFTAPMYLQNLAPIIRTAGTSVHTAMSVYAVGQTGIGALGMIGGTINDVGMDWAEPEKHFWAISTWMKTGSLEVSGKELHAILGKCCNSLVDKPNHNGIIHSEM
jgi:RHS repeat-associated protein